MLCSNWGQGQIVINNLNKGLLEEEGVRASITEAQNSLREENIGR
jgi:hypothetical protein